MNDRFAPPVSEIAGRMAAVPPPPAKLVLAVRLLWTSLGLGIPSFLYEVGRAPGGVEAGITAAVALVFFGIAAFLNVSIYRARNWARIVGLLLTVLEVGVLFLGATSPEEAFIEAICNWVAAALDVAAMYLLFATPASVWFTRAGPGQDL
ncbi:MAG: hypothetical protein M3Y32_07805 [Pseudomonadota bacterium]|nr:hypothetical protein [Pseudomonadota bacterium]